MTVSDTVVEEETSPNLPKATQQAEQPLPFYGNLSS